MSILNDRSAVYKLTKEDIFNQLYKTEIFIFKDRYSLTTFQGIMPDSGASGVSTAGEQQLKALQKLYP